MASRRLRPGPHNPVPESGRRHGYENRRKAVKHGKATVDLLTEALRHALRWLERTKGERLRDR
jgi:hypothetical protein